MRLFSTVQSSLAQSSSAASVTAVCTSGSGACIASVPSEAVSERTRTKAASVRDTVAR